MSWLYRKNFLLIELIVGLFFILPIPKITNEFWVYGTTGILYIVFNICFIGLSLFCLDEDFDSNGNIFVIDVPLGISAINWTMILLKIYTRTTIINYGTIFVFYLFGSIIYGIVIFFILKGLYKLLLLITKGIEIIFTYDPTDFIEWLKSKKKNNIYNMEK